MRIEVSDGVGAWLQEMAAKAGKDADAYADETLRQALENREDYEDAMTVARRLASGEEESSSLEEVERRLGLDD